jgi:hypothetical protein
MPFTWTLMLTLAFAVASFGSIGLPYPFFAFLGSSIFTLSWIALVVYSIVRFGRRGLRMLLGFPVAMLLLFYFFVGELMKCGALDCNRSS